MDPASVGRRGRQSVQRFYEAKHFLLAIAGCAKTPAIDRACTAILSLRHGE
jgi:hypothetical protein